MAITLQEIIDQNADDLGILINNSQITVKGNQLTEEVDHIDETGGSYLNLLLIDSGSGNRHSQSFTPTADIDMVSYTVLLAETEALTGGTFKIFIFPDVGGIPGGIYVGRSIPRTSGDAGFISRSSQ